MDADEERSVALRAVAAFMLGLMSAGVYKYLIGVI
jgi:hypothetical protein